MDADPGDPQNLRLWTCGGGNNQKWRLFGATVGLRAHANGLVVTAESAGAQPLIANRVVVDAWETFEAEHPTLFGRMYQFWAQKRA